MQLPGKNLLARFSISSLGNTKLNICFANLIISILQVWNSNMLTTGKTNLQQDEVINLFIYLFVILMVAL